jgi:hypothetical protein
MNSQLDGMIRLEDSSVFLYWSIYIRMLTSVDGWHCCATPKSKILVSKLLMNCCGTQCGHISRCKRPALDTKRMCGFPVGKVDQLRRAHTHKRNGREGDSTAGSRTRGSPECLGNTVRSPQIQEYMADTKCEESLTLIFSY